MPMSDEQLEAFDRARDPISPGYIFRVTKAGKDALREACRP